MGEKSNWEQNGVEEDSFSFLVFSSFEVDLACSFFK